MVPNAAPRSGKKRGSGFNNVFWFRKEPVHSGFLIPGSGSFLVPAINIVSIHKRVGKSASKSREFGLFKDSGTILKSQSRIFPLSCPADVYHGLRSPTLQG